VSRSTSAPSATQLPRTPRYLTCSWRTV
jgi:hypothetical protein